MDSHREDNKRIAKNTLLLYVRMFFLMIVGLYTSRVVLQALGETDFGIYNVVGGFVALFTVISGSLTSAISRFITYELGKGNRKRLSSIFSTSVAVQLLMALIIAMIAEPVGMWFINNKMTLPPDRIPAAIWVLQFSILTFAVNLVSVPYNAMIVAHEKMSAFAYIGIGEGIGKLAVALLILRSPFDALVFYSSLMCLVALGVRLAYGIYCRRHFRDCSFRPRMESGLFKEMAGFAGWNFIGAASGVLRDQGGHILVNLFYGPAVNAARGISFQLGGAVQSFVTNFMTAVNPQITKSYAAGDREYMLSLIRKSARFSYYLLLLLALPILFNTEYLLGLWLVDVPEHSVLFVQLFLMYVLSESVSNPLITAMLATGNIRNYQLVVGGLQLMNLPVSYILLRMGFFPEIVAVVAVVISQLCLAARLLMLRGMIGLSVRDYLKRVYFNVLAVTAVAIALPYMYSIISPDGFWGFAAGILVSLVSAALSILYVGAAKDERKTIVNAVISKLKRR